MLAINKVIGRRLRRYFASTLVLILTLSIISVLGFALTLQSFSTVVADRVLPMSQLKVVSDAYAVDVTVNVRNLASGYASPDDATANIRAALDRADGSLRAYLATWLTDEEQVLIGNLLELIGNARASILDQVASLARQRLPIDANLAVARVSLDIEPVTRAVSDLIQLQVDVTQAELKFARWVVIASILTVVLVSIVCLAVVIYLMRQTQKTVASPLEQITELMGRLSKGEVEIAEALSRAEGEFGELARAFDAFQRLAREKQIRQKNYELHMQLDALIKE